MYTLHNYAVKTNIIFGWREKYNIIVLVFKADYQSTEISNVLPMGSTFG